MRVLIADDDPITVQAVKRGLEQWGYDPIVTMDGLAAWNALEAMKPMLAVVDWRMPGLEGLEICRRVRRHPELAGTYVILLTGNSGKDDMLVGLESGSDDYIAKPFDFRELEARVRVGARIVGLQAALAARVGELQNALTNVKRLTGLLPICAYCKSIRDDQDYWYRLEAFISEHSDAQFTHGICPKCMTDVMDEVTDMEELGRTKDTDAEDTEETAKSLQNRAAERQRKFGQHQSQAALMKHK